MTLFAPCVPKLSAHNNSRRARWSQDTEEPYFRRKKYMHFRRKKYEHFRRKKYEHFRKLT